jgi:hypothetical protein
MRRIVNPDLGESLQPNEDFFAESSGGLILNLNEIPFRELQAMRAAWKHSLFVQFEFE